MAKEDIAEAITDVGFCGGGNMTDALFAIAYALKEIADILRSRNASQEKEDFHA